MEVTVYTKSGSPITIKPYKRDHCDLEITTTHCRIRTSYILYSELVAYLDDLTKEEE